MGHGAVPTSSTVGKSDQQCYDPIMNLNSVTEADLGVWVEGAAVHNPIEFNVAIVDLARAHGFELDEAAWSEDKPVFLNGDVSYDMLEDLGYVCDEALAWLNEQLPDYFYFDFEDGLVLCKEEVA